MANYYADTLKVKSVYVLDDSGAYGVGHRRRLSGAGQEARHQGARPRPARSRRRPTTRRSSPKSKSLNPDALYYGGVAQAGVKVVKQAYDILPKMIKGGGDGVYGAEILKGAGFPAAEGWYATIAAPNIARKSRGRAVDRALRQEIRAAARAITRSPPTMRRWSFSTRSSGSRLRARR